MAYKVLFIASRNRLGDTVMTACGIDYLLRMHSDLDITIACWPHAIPLFETLPCKKRFIPWEKSVKRAHVWMQNVGTLWDQVIILRGSNKWVRLFIARKYSLLDIKKRVPFVMQVGELLGGIGEPKIWISDENKKKGRETVARKDGEMIIAIAPFASDVVKEWPLEKFISFGSMAMEKFGPKTRVLLFSAPSEKERLLNIPDYIEIVPTTDNTAIVASCLMNVDLFIGNDSGLMHLAAAAGTPTLGLFGPTLNEVYAPWGMHATYIRTEESFDDLVKLAYKKESLMTSIKEEDVFEKALNLLEAVKYIKVAA